MTESNHPSVRPRLNDERSTIGSTRQREICSAIGFLAVAWLVLAWPWLSGRVTIPWDAKAHFLPQLQFLASSFAAGESPFWAPFVFSGHPQVADPQSLIFSPPFVALAYFNSSPTAHASDVTVFAMVLVSAAALLVWLTDRGVLPVAALIAAISFAFGAAMAWRIQHIGQVMSLAYLPIVLLTLDRALERHSALYAVLAGLTAACLVLGRDQIALMSVYLLIGYVGTRLWCACDPAQAFRAALKPLSIATMIGVMAIAIPLLLTVLIAADSNRPSIDLEGAGRGSLHPALGLTVFAPDVFGSSGAMGEYWGPPSGLWGGTGLYIAQNMGQLYFGALPALLVIAGVVSGRALRRDAIFFAAALGVCIVYALGWYTPIFAVFHGFVPGVDLYRRPADAVFLIGFLCAILSGLMLNAALRDDAGPTPLTSRSAIMTGLVVVAAFGVMLVLAVRFGMLANARYPVAMSAAMFVIAAVTLVAVVRWKSLSSRAVMAALTVVLVADLAWSNGPGGATALPPKNFAVLDPATRDDTIGRLKTLTTAGRSTTRRDRIELVGFDFHWPNASLTHGLENTLGYNPLRLGSYTRATGAGDAVGLPDQKNFSALFPSYRSTLSDLLGLRYIAISVPIETIDKALRPGDLRLVEKTTKGYIYENERALPRVLFATQADYADFDDIVARGTWPAVDFTSTVVLAKPKSPGGAAEQSSARTGPRGAGRASILRYGQTKITVEVDSPDGGWLVLNDIWQPWWVGTLNGAEVPILRANVLFRAVAVSPGRHTIEFTFQPIGGALRQVLGSVLGNRQ